MGGPAFNYAKKSGMCSQASYRYTAKDGSCKASSCTKVIPAGRITGYKDVSKGQASALMSAIQQGPVSVGVDASGFSGYKGGVLTKRCGTSINHGVLAVGYGTDEGNEYWKVKNSWGTRWGELASSDSPAKVINAAFLIWLCTQKSMHPQ